MITLKMKPEEKNKQMRSENFISTQDIRQALIALDQGSLFLRPQSDTKERIKKTLSTVDDSCQKIFGKEV